MKFIFYLLISIFALIFPVSAYAQSVSGTTSFNPTTVTVSANADFTVDLKMTLDQSVNAQIYTLNTSFDTSKLQLKTIEYVVGQASNNLGADTTANVSSINGRQSPAVIKVIGEVAGQNGTPMTAGQAVTLARLTFTARNTQPSTVSIASNASVVIVQANSTSVSIQLPTASLSVNSGGAGTSPSSATGMTTDTVKIVEDQRNTIPVDDPIWDNKNIVIEKRYSDVATGQQVPFTLREVVCVTAPCDTYPNGDRWVHVLFIGRDSAGTIYKKVESKSIYLALPPAISNVDCSVSSSGGTAVTINGTHFGDTVGSISLNNQNAQASATTWSNLSVSTTLSSKTQTENTVKLTTSEGQSVTSKCSLGQSQLDFTASLACRSVNKPLTTANIEIREINSVGIGNSAGVGIGSTASSVIPSGASGASIFKKDNVSFDSSGRPQGLNPPLIENKPYYFIIQAPLSLRKVLPFTARKGTTVLEALDLPLGDIAPERNDCTVNSLDTSRLYTEWASNSEAANRRGDLSQDGRVNSIDFACMRSNFNKSCEIIP